MKQQLKSSQLKIYTGTVRDLELEGHVLEFKLAEQQIQMNHIPDFSISNGDDLTLSGIQNEELVYPFAIKNTTTGENTKQYGVIKPMTLPVLVFTIVLTLALVGACIAYAINYPLALLLLAPIGIFSARLYKANTRNKHNQSMQIEAHEMIQN